MDIYELNLSHTTCSMGYPLYTMLYYGDLYHLQAQVNGFTWHHVIRGQGI